MVKEGKNSFLISSFPISQAAFLDIKQTQASVNCFTFFKKERNPILYPRGGLLYTDECIFLFSLINVVFRTDVRAWNCPEKGTAQVAIMQASCLLCFLLCLWKSYFHRWKGITVFITTQVLTTGLKLTNRVLISTRSGGGDGGFMTPSSGQ